MPDILKVSFIYSVGASLPNFTLIGATCRPCGAKNPKIGSWVKPIPAELPLWQILPVTKWKTSHFVISRQRASFDFHQILHDDRGGPCHHFTPKLFWVPFQDQSGQICRDRLRRQSKEEKGSPAAATTWHCSSDNCQGILFSGLRWTGLVVYHCVYIGVLWSSWVQCVVN